jgi:hypothetical protein
MDLGCGREDLDHCIQDQIGGSDLGAKCSVESLVAFVALSNWFVVAETIHQTHCDLSRDLLSTTLFPCVHQSRYYAASSTSHNNCAFSVRDLRDFETTYLMGCVGGSSVMAMSEAAL